MIGTHLDPDRTGECPELLDEQLFKQAVTRERKRADRSGLAMALFLISLPPTSVLEALDGAAVAHALAAAASEHDILGWFESSCVIGLIAPEIDPADLAGSCDRLESRVRGAISHRGGEELAQEVSMKLRVYPEQMISNEGQVSPLDPLLYPELCENAPAFLKFRFIKRGIDIMFSALLLILLSPAFALIGVLVKLSSPGPIIFRQIRVGHLMRPFTMCKFRTMYATADHQVHQDYVSWFITASDKAGTQEKPSVFKLTNDPRITPIGWFLRRTSLDELPQLWNVLIGDMSLVGPRPPVPYELQQYRPWHRRRLLEAMPGITGLWQVIGRSRTTFDEMVRLDLRYARTRSLWSDVKILVATPVAMITGKGAC
jgi:lipopolysaccharide/colanic/teichoic acid biosynthesis glycosyltransferase